MPKVCASFTLAVILDVAPVMVVTKLADYAHEAEDLETGCGQC
jgi:hypothetical protein